MNWQNIATLGIVLGVAVVFVWRSSGKKAGHSSRCNCGCSHDSQEEASLKKPNSVQPTVPS